MASFPSVLSCLLASKDRLLLEQIQRWQSHQCIYKPLPCLEECREQELVRYADRKIFEVAEALEAPLDP